ncbi:MAG: tRNA epoxyqueuosine(34) reductase QueG [Phycisphaerae bacterium]|nr:tRNA epoxyqueuosine(34) reductase QueG [Phycisphaerae bacterium]
MAADPGDAAGQIKARALELQFALCGIAEARPSDHGDHVRDWLAAGHHGEMSWLDRNLETRLDPRQLLHGARSVICVADRIPASPPGPAPIGHGRVAAYAQVDDYHKVLKRRLFRLADGLRPAYPQHGFRVCVDTAPVLEHEHAQRAGIGWVGKHTLTLHARLGSHLLLGEILTTLPLPADEPAEDHCGTCTRCIDACPTDCIRPYQLDASRCLSYLTIEHRGPIDPDFFPAMGDWIYGCDICQDVCPFNQRPHTDPPPDGYGRRPASLGLLQVLAWNEQDRRAAFTRSAMKRAKLDQMKRNALIVAGNQLRRHPDPALRHRLEQVSHDPDETDMVRATAQAILDRQPPVENGS